MQNQNKELAIAGVLCQEWDKVYDFETALKVGTIFPDLNMPFFMADDLDNNISRCSNKPIEQLEREELMIKIDEVSFALNDLLLYLDTHEGDTEAIKLFKEGIKRRAELLKQFSQKFYPLTQCCICNTETCDCFSWSKGAMVWEGACI